MVDGLALSLFSIDIVMILHNGSKWILQVVVLNIFLHDELLVTVLRLLSFLSLVGSLTFNNLIWIVRLEHWWLRLGLYHLYRHNLANFLTRWLWLNLGLLDQSRLSWAPICTAATVWTEVFNLGHLGSMLSWLRGWVSGSILIFSMTLLAAQASPTLLLLWA